MVRVKCPIWITKINRRMSMKKFRKQIDIFRSLRQDFSRILDGVFRHVYEVKVDTWAEGEQTIWVPERMVKITGEMFAKFIENELIMEDDDEDSDCTIVENECTSSLHQFGEMEEGFEESDYGEDSFLSEVDTMIEEMEESEN